MSWCNAVLLACNTAAALHLKTKQINMLVLPKIKIAANVDMVCFDKTGTLTESEVRVGSVEKAKASVVCQVFCSDKNTKVELGVLAGAMTTVSWDTASLLPREQSVAIEMSARLCNDQQCQQPHE